MAKKPTKVESSSFRAPLSVMSWKGYGWRKPSLAGSFMVSLF